MFRLGGCERANELLISGPLNLRRAEQGRWHQSLRLANSSWIVGMITLRRFLAAARSPVFSGVAVATHKTMRALPAVSVAFQGETPQEKRLAARRRRITP